MPAGITLPASMTSGVTKSGLATNLVPKVVGDVAASGATSLGLGALLGALGPAYTIYGVLDALGFFDKGMEATPMTPEEEELNNAAAKVDRALALVEKASIGGIAPEDSEGMAPEVYLLDAYEAVNALPDSELEFFGDTKDGLLSSLARAGLSDEELKIEEIDEGLRSPVFPFLEYPTLEDLEAGGGGGGGDTAASAASSEAASAASSQTDTGTGDWIYDADAGLFRESGGIETFIPVPGTYTDGQTISYDDAAEIFGEWGKNSTTNTATIPTSTSTATTTTGSGANDSSLNLPTVLYLPDFGGADGTGTLTLPTFTAGTGTTGTGTTGTGTTGTGTTGTGTTGTGTTGTGAANLGGTGGGLSTGTGTGDGSGTGSGTGTGDGAGDGSGTGDGVGDGTGDGTGREQGEAQELADLLGGGGMRGVATEQAGVADISMLYDPSLSLAENMARILGKKKNEQADAVDSALMYGGGIVQPTDLNNELLRIIGGR
jgi:hypothetical protein